MSPQKPPTSGEAIEVPPWRPEHGPRPEVLVYPHGREPLLWIYAHGAWCYAVARGRFRTPQYTAYQVHIHPPGTLYVFIRTYRWGTDAVRILRGPKPPVDGASQTR
ncbi:hypothetical protein ACEZCY_14085 [Streptacidiphilus sp. N1-12]|uniref:Uncharacterized protein n=2 Tax=Streptacidiphilus alkalitolerans TaxID=3342712 RepID=A0ABV6V9J3_9ACTN